MHDAFGVSTGPNTAKTPRLRRVQSWGHGKNDPVVAVAVPRAGSGTGPFDHDERHIIRESPLAGPFRERINRACDELRTGSIG